jgi:enoyl-CoA hydratase/carnithine racemase
LDSSNILTYELRDRVAWIGLNRPAKRNAINDLLLAVLEAAVRRAQGEARAMVIFGHGPCFSAGLDLSEHRSREPAEVFRHSRSWHAAFSVIRHGPIPAIAALHGAAVAFFALPEGQRGIYVGGGASVHVARLLGVSRVTDMMLTGRVLDAATAERMGLVNYLAEAGGALDKAAELASRMTDMAPLTVLGVLSVLPRIENMTAEDGLFVESMMAALSQTGPEAAARMTDFVEKRGPRITGPDES